MALEAIYHEPWAQEIEVRVLKDDESKRRADAGLLAAELEHERLGWRNGCRQGAEAGVSGEYENRAGAMLSDGRGKRQRVGGKIGVLMICQSNLDRSPAAAAVFHAKAEAVGAGNCFFVDSASTGGGSPVCTAIVSCVGCSAECLHVVYAGMVYSKRTCKPRRRAAKPRHGSRRGETRLNLDWRFPRASPGEVFCRLALVPAVLVAARH